LLPPSLTSLNVTGCTGLTGGVRFGHLVRLLSLQAQNIPSLTDAAIESVAPSVTEVDLSGSTGVSEAAKARLRARGITVD